MTVRDAVEDWLAQHGAPRRFELGASASPDHLKAFLSERGWEVTAPGWQDGRKCVLKRAGAKGPSKKLTMRELVAFVDDLRMAEGLEPIVPREVGS